MKHGSLARLDRSVHRAADIIGVLAKYRLADWAKDLDVPWIQDRLRSASGQHIPDLEIEERVRLALTELGPTFIKLGQMLSTRPDLVGPELAEELAQLQSETPADPPATVLATIEAEFGKPASELFAHFEEVPLASASIAQVHAARLRTGEAVVVKVQHSRIEDKIKADLDILGGLAELAEKHSSRLRPYQPEAVVRQFRRTLLRELDFTSERRNLEQFASNFAGDDRVHFPLAYAPLCTRRVLTMEKLNGISATRAKALADSGVDLDEFAHRGATMYLDMIFRDALYHADPHPGNLMLLPGGVVGMLDFGMVGRLDEDLSDDLDDMLLAVVKHDSANLAETLLRVGVAPPATRRDILRSDLTDFIADYVGQSLRDLSLSDALNSLFEIIHRHNITLPPQLTMLLRTLVELEGTGRRLSPTFSLAEVIRPFYDTRVRKRLSVRRLLGRLQDAFGDWERLAASVPRDLNDALRRLREGTFYIQLEHRHIDPAVNRLVLGLMTAALVVGSSLLWSMKAPPLIRDVSVVGAVGYVVAAHLGWRVLRAIRKSGNISSGE